MGGETKVPVTCGRKNCTHCKRWLHITEFYVRQRSSRGTPLLYQSFCKACQRKLRRHSAGMKRRGKPYGARRDKMTKKQRRARRRELYQEQIKDEKFRAELRERQRIYAEAKRREQGIEPRNFAEKTLPGYGDLLPYEPLKEWIEAKLGNGYMGSVPDLAMRCGVDESQINRVLRGEHERISEDFVDKILIAEGSTYLGAVYPDLYL